MFEYSEIYGKALKLNFSYLLKTNDKHQQS